MKTPSSRLLRAAERIYQLMLIAYPVTFRRAYGDAMAQLFRDCARDALRQHGVGGLIGWCVCAFSDLARAAGRQWAMEAGGQLARHWSAIAWACLALALSGATGYLNTHTDELLVVLPWVLLICGLFALLRPHGAWLVALLIGLAVPASQVVATAFHIHVPYAITAQGIADSCLALVPALAGAAAGAVLGWGLHSL